MTSGKPHISNDIQNVQRRPQRFYFPGRHAVPTRVQLVTTFYPYLQLTPYSNTGVFLELHVDTVRGTDLEAFSVLHHTGRKALYGIRRRAN